MLPTLLARLTCMALMSHACSTNNETWSGIGAPQPVPVPWIPSPHSSMYGTNTLDNHFMPTTGSKVVPESLDLWYGCLSYLAWATTV